MKTDITRIMLAFNNSIKELTSAQQEMKKANPLAVALPVYDRLSKIIREVTVMLHDVPKLPL